MKSPLNVIAADDFLVFWGGEGLLDNSFQRNFQIKYEILQSHCLHTNAQTLYSRDIMPDGGVAAEPGHLDLHLMLHEDNPRVIELLHQLPVLWHLPAASRVLQHTSVQYY